MAPTGFGVLMEASSGLNDPARSEVGATLYLIAVELQEAAIWSRMARRFRGLDRTACVGRTYT